MFVWPPAADEPTSIEDYESLPENSPWKNFPATLRELGIPVRDTLAAITPDQLTDLVTLARQARDAEQMLYVWNPAQ